MAKKKIQALRDITIVGARQHNLKNIDVQIPRNKLVVITGPSGSGKSSLAFDTLYAEGQRRYVESLSAYARQFLDQMTKPEVEHIEGLSPAIAIEQRSAGGNPRSIVATTTEIYDYLRLLFAHIGKPHCPKCGKAVSGQTAQQISDHIMAQKSGKKLMLLAPYVQGKKGEHKEVLEQVRKDGFVRLRVDGEIIPIDDAKPLKKSFKHSIEAVVDRLVSGKLDMSRLTDSVERSLKIGGGNLILMIEDEKKKSGWREEQISEELACTDCHISIGELQPRNFSFNSPYGACNVCHGIGSQSLIDEEQLIENPQASLEKAIPLLKKGPRRLIQYNRRSIKCVADFYDIDLDEKLASLSKEARQVLLYGSAGEEVPFSFRWGGRQYRKSKVWEGIIPMFERRYQETESKSMKDRLRKIMVRQSCPSCKGHRLRDTSLAVTVQKKNISDFIEMSVDDAHDFVSKMKLVGEEKIIASEILREVESRLSFLVSVGLGYLNLNRESGTLSGGEAQRIRLATQVGSGLTGVLYVLDEPSIGLHQRDNQKLLDTLKKLRDVGNTVVVVEHDLDTILQADHILDIGPGAGVHGGEVVAKGTPAAIKRSSKSLTGAYLNGTKEIALPEQRVAGDGDVITIAGARMNNLKDIDVRIPLGTFTCVTGVSGSGKSSLINGILAKAISKDKNARSQERPGDHDAILGMDQVNKMIVIDQSPIGRTPRSNPATYTGAFDLIRSIFSTTKESQARGYKPGRFSFNVKGGRCEDCSGDGIKKIEMQFLPDVYVPCETCKGARYNRETLTITYRGRTIADVLNMTVEDGCKFFEHHAKLSRILETLNDVGLGYIRLGQSATTLSGGEAQRVKLASQLARPKMQHTLYILDEPTTGLHMDDVNKLLEVLCSLRDNENTVLVIEHNLDVIKVCDWIIDLGPEGGEGGGQIIAEGPPEKIAKSRKSHTGRYLKDYLK